MHLSYFESLSMHGITSGGAPFDSKRAFPKWPKIDAQVYASRPRLARF